MATTFSFDYLDRAVRNGGGLHYTRVLDGKGNTLCQELSDVKIPLPYALTGVPVDVSCQTCLEWLHA